MGVRKSPVGTIADLLCSLITDVTLLCGSDPKEAERDAQTLRERVRCEGLGFCTKVLPKLGKAIDRSFETGVLESPNNFRKVRGSEIPVFLQGISRLVYSEDGCLRPRAMRDLQAVKGLRQLCFSFYKLELPYSDLVVDGTLASFVSTDAALPDEVAAENDEVLLLASQLLEEVLADFDPLAITPGHGPGAVATGERGWGKYDFKRRFNSIHSVYSYPKYFLTRGIRGTLRDKQSWYASWKREEHGIAKVVLVPKDSRGPRLISCEPLEFQWMQQGLGRALVRYLEGHKTAARGLVNFTDQSVNRTLARIGSSWETEEPVKVLKFPANLVGFTNEANGVTGCISSEKHLPPTGMATIDMKDASDRVSLALVRALFPDHVLDSLEALRTSATRLPNGMVVWMKKYAPMGSSLCFPVEALVFWAISTACMAELKPGGKSWHLPKCYVYGDDILVPVRHFEKVVATLERYALVVNRDKSYAYGPFRESCGGDYLDGSDVTPVKFRYFTDLSPDAKSYPHLVEGIHKLWLRGYWKTMDDLHRLVESRWGVVPAGSALAGYPCIRLDHPAAVAYNRDRVKTRWDEGLQRWEHRVRTVKTEEKRDDFEGWGRLIRGLTTDVADDPLAYSVRKRTFLKWSWRAI
jgi:hypothetical protein